jgi:pilus assembly protein Flp/PilA
MLSHYVDLYLSDKIRKFAANMSGVTAIEYGLIAAGIAVAIIVAVNLLGTELAALFTTVKNKI